MSIVLDQDIWMVILKFTKWMVQDSWAICRIFKKTNSTAQRALSLSSIPPLSETNTSDAFTKNDTFFPTKTTLPSSETHQSSISNTYPFDFVASCNPFNTQITSKFSHLPILAEPTNTTEPATCRVDLSSILLNMSSSVLGDFGIKPTDTLDLHAQQQFMSNYPQTLSHEMQAVGDQFGAIRSTVGCPNLSLPLSMSDLGKSSFIWDSSSSCPSEVSTSLSTTNCYTWWFEAE